MMREMSGTLRVSIKEERLRRRLSKAALARLAGVSQGTIAKAERGCAIRDVQQQAIADALGFARHELFEAA